MILCVWQSFKSRACEQGFPLLGVREKAVCNFKWCGQNRKLLILSKSIERLKKPEDRVRTSGFEVIGNFQRVVWGCSVERGG